jgi:hypothetical protein
MVLEGAFDNLMKKVRGEELVDISTWKVRSERLDEVIRTTPIRYNVN